MSTDTAVAGPSTAATPPERVGNATPPSKQSVAERMRTDTCFKCQKQGHWARDCPKIPQKASASTQLVSKLDTDFPVVLCRRGHASCSVQTSASEKNPNRKYYECPLKRNGGCDFFKWCDEMGLPEFVPVCDCGAGKCCADRVKVGPNAGRWLFTCRVRKGHGACQFFQWEDAQSHATMNGSADRKHGNSPSAMTNPELDKTANNDSGKGGNSSFQCAKKMKIGSSTLHNHHLSPNSASMLGPSAAALPSGSSKQKTRMVARSLYFSDVPEIAQDVESGLPMTNNAEICPRPLSREISAAKDTLVGGSVQPACPRTQCTISDNEESLVSSLRNDICCILELKGANDPTSMERVVNPILDALDYLSPDNNSFRGLVGEFTRCASSLARFEHPISSEPATQDVTEMYNIKKGKLCEISRQHSEALDAFKETSEEATRLRESLVQIKKQLSWCEMEMEKLKGIADEMCRERAECERSLQVMEEAVRCCRKREEEAVAAREAFEKARNQLRQGV